MIIDTIWKLIRLAQRLYRERDYQYISYKHTRELVVSSDMKEDF